MSTSHGGTARCEKPHAVNHALFGRMLGLTGLAVANQHKTDYLYGGKEKPQLFGIDWYDSAARWQTTSGIFVSPDPLMEKYYSISPYAYCAGNPVNLVDPEGREIYVSKEYQEQFMSDLQNVFGDKVKFFYFNDEGLLQLNSSAKEFRKGLSKDQKGAFKGLNKAMSDKEVTSIVYSDFFDVTMGGTAKTVDVVLQFGGGLYSKTENLIVIAPSVGDVNVTVFDSNYIGEQTIKQNTTSVLFHEIGERNTKDEHYRGDVVDYENYARRVLGLPIRPYDLFHSHTVPQN